MCGHPACGEERPGQLLSVCRGPPSPATKHVGRPTRQEAWVERVQRALRADEHDSVRALSSLEVPPWRRPGLGLEPPSEADVDAITVKTREHEQDVVRELDGPPKPKRVKVQPPPEAVQCTTAGRRRGAHAQLHLGSQRVFGGINRSSIHRWKLKKKPHSGRPHKLSETQFLSAAVPLS